MNVLDDGPQGKVRGNVPRRNTTKRFLMLGRDLSTKKMKTSSKCENFQLFGNLYYHGDHNLLLIDFLEIHCGM